MRELWEMTEAEINKLEKEENPNNDFYRYGYDPFSEYVIKQAEPNVSSQKKKYKRRFKN